MQRYEKRWQRCSNKNFAQQTQRCSKCISWSAYFEADPWQIPRSPWHSENDWQLPVQGLLFHSVWAFGDQPLQIHKRSHLHWNEERVLKTDRYPNAPRSKSPKKDWHHSLRLEAWKYNVHWQYPVDSENSWFWFCLHWLQAGFHICLVQILPLSRDHHGVALRLGCGYVVVRLHPVRVVYWPPYFPSLRWERTNGIHTYEDRNAP